MHNLIRFIKLNQFILLFIIVESFSIYLLIQNNTYQQSFFNKNIVKYTSNIFNTSKKLQNYFKLKEQNLLLAKENAKLYSILDIKSNMTDSNLEMSNLFSYQQAKIVNNSIHKRNNFITLNKGKKHGIKEGMGVITQNGVIGIIKSVSENYSIAISLLNRKSSLGVKLKKNYHNGILKWDGFNYRIASITNFPSHISIAKGDSISTNSHSTIFPENIDIGVINSFEKKQGGYFNVSVKLHEDFNKLYFVYIVKSLNSNEKMQLEKNTNE